jgi:hypothetical protein
MEDVRFWKQFKLHYYATVKKLTKSKVVDWPDVSSWITADIATRLQASPEFMNAERLREQCWHAC